MMLSFMGSIYDNDSTGTAKIIMTSYDQLQSKAYLFNRKYDYVFGAEIFDNEKWYELMSENWYWYEVTTQKSISVAIAEKSIAVAMAHPSITGGIAKKYGYRG